MKNGKVLLSTEEMADLLGVSYRKLLEWRATYNLPVIQIGPKRFLWYVGDIERIVRAVQKGRPNRLDDTKDRQMRKLLSQA